MQNNMETEQQKILKLLSKDKKTFRSHLGKLPEFSSFM